MSFLDKLLGKNNKQIIKEPENELMKAPPEDIMVVKKENQQPADNLQKEYTNNKDSPP